MNTNMKLLFSLLLVTFTALTHVTAQANSVVTSLTSNADCGSDDPCISTFAVDSGITEVDFSMIVVGTATTYINSGTFRAMTGDVYTVTRSLSANSMTISGPVYNRDGLVDGVTNIMSRVDATLTQSSFLTALSASTDAALTESSVVLTTDDACDPPQALEKNLNPRLMPTSRLYLDNGVSKLELTVEIPSYYYDVQFSWNHQFAAPVVNALIDTLARAPDQCVGDAFNRFVATTTSAAGASSCMSWYTVDVAYADDCTFSVEDSTNNPGNLEFSGILYVIAKTPFSGDVQIGAFQEVVSPIQWRQNLATQITVNSNFNVTNLDSCDEDDDCNRSLCNKDRGTEVAGGRVCGSNKVGVCHWTSAGKYVSICVSDNAILTGHSLHANDIIPAVTAIGYVGSAVFLGSTAGPVEAITDYSAFLNAQCEFTPLPNFCDCLANGYTAAGASCGGDHEPPEWVACGSTGEVSVTATWSQIEADPSLDGLFSGNDFPTVRDNSGDGVTVLSTVQNTGAADGSDVNHSLTLNAGTGLYEIQPVTEIDVLVYSTRIVMIANDADPISASAQCVINLTVTDDKPPIMTCPDYPTTAPLRTNTWTGAWSDSDVTAIDERDGALTPSTTTDMIADPAQGLHEITYSATDNSNNYASCNFFVYFDNVAPVLTNCPVIDTVTDPGADFATISWTNPTATDEATDSCTGTAAGALNSVGCTVTTVVTTTTNPFTHGLENPSRIISTFTATDSLGNTASCQFYVKVVDNEPPTVSCDQSGSDAAGLNALSMQPGKNYAILPDLSSFFGANDNVGVVGASFSPLAGAQLSAGPHIITWGAADAAGLSDSCSITITVVDTEAPTVNFCPPNAQLAVRSGVSDGTWLAAIPSATYADNYLPQVPTDITHTVTMTGNAGFSGDIGDEWAVGVYTIVWTARDAALNANNGECVTVITVIDDTSPVIGNCAVLTTFSQDTDLNLATWTPSLGSHWITTLSAADNIAVTSTTMDGVADIAAFLATPLPLGAHTIAYVATDAAGNQSTCEFTVTVEDNQIPTVDCSGAGPAVAAISTESYSSASGSATRYNVAHPWNKDAANAYTFGTGADNVAGEFDITTFVETDNSPSAFSGLFTLTVTTTVTDRHNNAPVSCEYQIRVVDVTDPTVDCALVNNGDRVYNTDAGESYATLSFNSNGAASDNVAVSQTAFLYNGVDAQGVQFASGAPNGAEYVITHTALDHFGNDGFCTFTITVRDTESPTSAECPAGALAAATVGTDARLATYSGTTWNPSFADNVALSGSVAVSSVNGGVTTTLSAWPTVALPLGLNTITIAVVDTSGNESSCSFDVTVEDREAPFPETGDSLCSHVSIARLADFGTTSWTPADIFTSPEDGKSRGGWWSPKAEPTWIDNVDGAAAVITMQDVFAAGVPADPTATVNQVVTYGQSLASGIHTITVTATDAANNVATCSFVINVGDGQGPLMTCPQDLTQPTNAGENYWDQGFPLATASDNQGPVTPTASTAQNTQFAVGTHTITFSADDSAYNLNPITTTCSFILTIEDREVPVISDCGGPASSLSAVVTNGVTTYTVAMDSYGTTTYSGSWSGPTSTDNVAVVSTVTTEPNNPNALPIGSHTISYVVDDASDKSGHATCSFIIIVVDTYDPIATCTSGQFGFTGIDGIIDNTFSKDYWLGAFTTPSGAAADNVAGVTSTLTVGTSAGPAANGHLFMVEAPGAKAYTIVLTATDLGGRTHSCTFIINVADTEDPSSPEYTSANPTSPSVINSASGVSEFPTDSSGGNQCNSSAGSTYTGNWFIYSPALTAVDNVAVDTIVRTVTNTAAGITDQAIATNGELQVGVNVIKYVITDTSGNTATRYISITVADKESPTIQCPASLTLALPSADSLTAVTTVSPVQAGQSISITACDNVDADSSVDTSSFNNSPFSLGGPYPNTFVTTDSAGYLASCNVPVTVVDNTPPTVTAQNIEIDTTGATTSVTFDISTTNNGPRTVTITDNVTGSPVSSDITQFPIGVTTVKVSVTDGTYTVDTTFTVTVWDNEAPYPLCPNDMSIAVEYSLDDATQTQTVAHALLGLSDNSPTCNPASSASAVHATLGAMADANQLKFGVNTITYSANDNACLQARGLTGTCAFTVTITDAVAPTPDLCVSAITVNSMIAGVRSLQGGWSVPSWTDNYDLANTLLLGGSGPSPTDDLVLGANSVTYTAADLSDNGNICSMIVTLVDTAPPQIACPSNIPSSSALLMPDGSSSLDYTYIVSATDDLTARADICIKADNTGACLTLSNNDSYSQSVNMGRNDFSFTATDEAGLAHTCTWFVYVADATPPTVPVGECPADFTIRASGTMSESVILSFTSGSGALRTVSFSDPSIVIGTSILSHFTDNVDVEAHIVSAFAGMPANGIFPVGDTTVYLLGTDSSGNRIEQDGTITRRGVATADTAVPCSFTVTVLHEYEPNAERRAFLNRVFIQEIDAVTNSFGAYVEITTNVPWPHRLSQDTTPAQGALNPLEVSSDCPVVTSDANGHNSADCDQVFGTVVTFPQGCSISEQKYSLSMESFCNNGVTDCVYANQDWVVEITLSADNYCAVDLADVEVTATLRTYTDAAFDTFVADPANAPASSGIFFDGDKINGVVSVSSPQVQLQSTTLISIFAERQGLTTTLYNTPEGGSATGVVTEEGTTIDAPTASWASFDYPAIVAADSTVTVNLEATVALEYILTAGTGRRLLRKIVNVKLNQPKRGLKQAANGAEETERTAKTPYTALNIRLDGTDIIANADGTFSVIVGRILVNEQPSVEEALAYARIAGEQISLQLGTIVSCNLLSIQGNSVIVSVAHDESKTSLLKEHMTDKDSDLNATMRQNVQFEFDPEYFYEGDIQSTNVDVKNSSGSSDDDNLPAIIGGVAAGAICCAMILFFLIKKRAKEDDEDLAVKPNRRNSQVSVNDIVVEDADLASTPVRRLSWISRQECAPETAASIASAVSTPGSSRGNSIDSRNDGTVVVNLA